MKKIYSTIALASLLVASASAASPMVAGLEKSLDYQAQSLQKNLQPVVGSAVKEQKNVSTRAITSVDDICQPYDVPEWMYMLQGDAPIKDISFNITKAEGNSVFLQCNYLDGSCEPLLATFNPANQTLTIKTDDNQGLYNSPQHGPLGLEMSQIEWDPTPNADGTYNGKWVDKASVTVEISNDGKINFSDIALMWKWTDKGSYTFGAGRFVLTPFEYFTYNAAEWVEVGNASYTDGFFAPILSQATPADLTNEVPCYASKLESGVFLLMNPYGVGIWPQVFDRETTGYIRFDISNPDCVTMTPLVPSGAWIDYSEAEDGSDLQQFFLFNREGLRFYNGMSTESMVEEAEEAMDPFKETLADYLSSYDEDTNTVNFINCFFGQTDAPLSDYTWVDSNRQPYKLTAKVVLPDLSGVNDIITDSNAPVKYFNLQGMEVANPEAGQLVIKKQGRKSTKLIAK